jgi:hypothetical protein
MKLKGWVLPNILKWTNFSPYGQPSILIFTLLYICKVNENNKKEILYVNEKLKLMNFFIVFLCVFGENTEESIFSLMEVYNFNQDIDGNIIIIGDGWVNIFKNAIGIRKFCVNKQDIKV